MPCKSVKLSFRDELGLLWRRHVPRYDMWVQRVLIAAALGWVAFITFNNFLKQ